MTDTVPVLSMMLGGIVVDGVIVATSAMAIFVGRQRLWKRLIDSIAYLMRGVASAVCAWVVLDAGWLADCQEVG